MVSPSAHCLLFSSSIVAHGTPPGKVKLGDDATPAEVIEHLRREAGEGEGGVSEELEALMRTPLEVTVKKSVRKTTVTTGGGKASFEVTGVFVGMSSLRPHPYDDVLVSANLRHHHYVLTLRFYVCSSVPEVD